MSRTKTPSFVATIPLKTSKSDELELKARFNAGQNLYNACLTEAKKRLDLVRNSNADAEAKARPKKDKKLRLERFKAAKVAYRYSEYDLHAFATKTAKASKWIAHKLDAQAIQTIATRAFKASEQMLFGNAKKVRFKGKSRYRSIEGKTNKQGRFKDECLVWGLKGVLINQNDPVILHALNSPIKFCRMIRKTVKSKQGWYLQLVCEGLPYTKPKNLIGEGIVGIDLNVSGVGVVSDAGAFIKEFCVEVDKKDRLIKRLQRKNARQLRANNPQNYAADFRSSRGQKTVTKKGRVKKGSKKWNRSKRYLKTQHRKAEIQRSQREHRKSLHGHLVNVLLRQGNHFKMERISVKAWQKKWGEQIGYKAPGEFQSLLVRKAESAGGRVDKFSCQNTKLSQTCICGKVEKKSLSQRIHKCECGVEVKRDVLSAFLARSVTDDHLIMSSVLNDWGRLETAIRQA
ncbi:zinc ribbon domain-containing protein [Microseira sp. BLCC-F43]|uniref:zinc ribbon domain-containing protein n=1 Tax=Microseira sp. BLCC-F43 TaxID=3153602 RepID=UPI0035B9D7DA